MIDTSETSFAPAAGETLAQRMKETRHVSPLRRHAVAHGLRDEWDLLTLAVQRGCGHFAGVAPKRAVTDLGEQLLSNEELVMLLLAGENRFEPFLIRAAAGLLRVGPMDAARLAWLARRDRTVRVLAYIARAGAEHDSESGAFWLAIVTALGPAAPVAPGVLPHWSRFVVLRGVDRGGHALANRWIGAAS